MTKAKGIVLMAKQPLINAKKLKPRDREAELFAKDVYCKSLTNLMKEYQYYDKLLKKDNQDSLHKNFCSKNFCNLNMKH